MSLPGSPLHSGTPPWGRAYPQPCIHVNQVTASAARAQSKEGDRGTLVTHGWGRCPGRRSPLHGKVGTTPTKAMHIPAETWKGPPPLPQPGSRGPDEAVGSGPHGELQIWSGSLKLHPLLSLPPPSLSLQQLKNFRRGDHFNERAQGGCRPEAATITAPGCRSRQANV